MLLMACHRGVALHASTACPACNRSCGRCSAGFPMFKSLPTTPPPSGCLHLTTCCLVATMPQVQNMLGMVAGEEAASLPHSTESSHSPNN